MFSLRDKCLSKLCCRRDIVERVSYEFDSGTVVGIVETDPCGLNSGTMSIVEVTSC